MVSPTKAEYKKLHVKSVHTISGANDFLEIYNSSGDMISSTSIYPGKKNIDLELIITYSRQNDTLIQQAFYQKKLSSFQKKVLRKIGEGYLMQVSAFTGKEDELSTIEITRFSDSAGWTSQVIKRTDWGYPAKILMDLNIREENLSVYDSIKFEYDFKKKIVYEYSIRSGLNLFAFNKYTVTHQFDPSGKPIHLVLKVSNDDENLNTLKEVKNSLNSLTNTFGDELNKNDQKSNDYNFELERSEDYTYLKGKILQTTVTKQSNISGRILIKTEKFETLLYSNGLPQIKYLIAENNERKVLQSWVYKYY